MTNPIVIGSIWLKSNKNIQIKVGKIKKEAEYSFAKKRVSMPLIKKKEAAPGLFFF